jgi:hypothetical protein
MVVIAVLLIILMIRFVLRAVRNLFQRAGAAA